MSFASALFYPILLLLPAASVDDEPAASQDAGMDAVRAELWPPLGVLPVGEAGQPGAIVLSDAFPDEAAQIRIEQRMTIRVAPRASMPMPEMFFALPSEAGSEIVERKIGKCLPVAGIASVRPDRGNRLLLLMRDRRVVSAELDRSCRSRDFYSGFLMQRSEDGRLCVDRDTLLSRSGMSCTLTRIRQLVERER